MRTLWATGFVIFGVGTANVCWAQSAYEVTNPFSDPISREHFGVCYPETPKDELNALSNIERYAYNISLIEGCPPTSPNCNPKFKFFRGQRRTTVSLADMRPSRARSIAESLASGGCSPTSVSGFSQSISSRSVRYQVHVEHTERICTFLGDLTVGSGSADIQIGFDLTPDLRIVPYQAVFNEHRSVNIFGAIMGTLVGSTIVGGGAAAAGMTAIFTTRQLNWSSPNFLGLGIRTTSIGRPLQHLSEGDLEPMRYQLEEAETGVRLTGDDLTLSIVQSGYLRRELMSPYDQMRQFEIEFIKALPEIDPEIYIAKPGDSLWGIVARRFGDGRLMTFVARYAGMERPRELRAGEVVKLPRWYEICQRLRPKSLLVKEGESMWSKARDGQIPFSFSRIDHLSNDPNLIYPFEELEVRR